MKNLSIHNSDATSVTSVLSPPSLLEDSFSVNQSSENLFIIFFDFSFIFNSSDLFYSAHLFSSATFFIFTEQKNCDLYSHTQITHIISNSAVSDSFISDTDFRNAEFLNADINHATSDSDWINERYDSNDSFISSENEDTTALMSFIYIFTAIQIAEWVRHHADVSEMLH